MPCIESKIYTLTFYNESFSVVHLLIYSLVVKKGFCSSFKLELAPVCLLKLRSGGISKEWHEIESKKQKIAAVPWKFATLRTRAGLW